MTAIAYAIAWQLAWFAGVLGAAHGWPWIGPVAAVPALILAYRVQPMTTLHLAVLAGCLGWLADAALGFSGLAVFVGGDFSGRASPPWMLALWMLYAVAFTTCLGWTTWRPWLPPLLAALSAPGAYLGGEALGALRVTGDRIVFIVAVAAVYAVATSLFVRLLPKPQVSP